MRRCSRHSASSSTAAPRPCRRGGPTSSGRSTSSRRSPGAIGLDQIRRTVPSNPEKIGALTTVPARAPRSSPTCSSAPATTRCTRCRCSRPPIWPRRARRPRRRSRSRTRCAPRSRCCARHCCPGVLRAVAHNAAHGNPDVQLFELGRVFGPPAAGGHAAASSGCISRSRARAGVRDAARSRPRRRPSHDLVAVVEALAAELRLADWRLAGRTRRRVPSRARRRDRGRRRRHRRGRRDRSRRRRGARRSPNRSSRASSTSTRCSTAPRVAARRAPGLALPGVGDRPRVRRRRRRPGRRGPATAARSRRRPARMGARVRRLPLRRARDRAGEPGVRAAVPRARPHADRRRGRRAPRGSASTRSCRDSAPSSRDEHAEPFTHRIRVRYAEVDGQGVVFNAHWLTYFDETCTRFVESWGFGADYWIHEFDVMLVKAVLEWSGPARFDEWVDDRGRAGAASARSRSMCATGRRSTAGRRVRR